MTTRTIYFCLAVLLTIANGALYNAFGLGIALKNFPVIHLIIPGLILMFQGYLLGKAILD